MVQGVFFDLFQTLVRYDPPREEMISAALAEQGIEAAPERFVKPIVVADEFIYQEMARQPLSQQSREQRLALYIRYQEILYREAGIDIDPSLIPLMLQRMQSRATRMVLFDDVIPVLDMLREHGIKIGMISNVDTDMSATFRELGLTDKMDVIMTSREAGITKPDPGIFLATLEKAGIEPGQGIFIGDQYEIDVAGSRKAGMTAILLDRTDSYPGITDCPRILRLDEIIGYL